MTRRPDIAAPEKTERRVPVTADDLFPGAHVVYGGPLSNFDCTIVAVIGDQATLRAVRSETEFVAPVSKLSVVEREAS